MNHSIVHWTATATTTITNTRAVATATTEFLSTILPSETAIAQATETAIADATESLASSSDWPVYYPYFVVVFAFEIFASLLGTYGSLWVIYQYFRKRILNNTPGLIICLIAFIDFFFSFYYMFGISVQYALSPLAINVVWNVTDSAFDWCLITYSMLGMLLAFNTLFIVMGGSSALVDRYKWFAIAICFILPIPAFYWPTSNWRHQWIFTTFDVYHCNPAEGDCENIKSNILIFSIVTFALLCSFLAYFGIWISLKRAGHEQSASRRTTIIAKRLVMVYSLAIIASWIPWWVRWVFVNFIDQGAHNDLDYLSTFSFGTLIILFRALWTPMRGYIHAVAVFWVFRVVAVTDKITIQNSWRYFFLMKKLNSGESSKDSSEKQESLERTIDAPNWTIDSKDAGFSTTFPNSVLSHSDRYASRASGGYQSNPPYRESTPNPSLGRFAPRTTSRPGYY